MLFRTLNLCIGGLLALLSVSCISVGSHDSLGSMKKSTKVAVADDSASHFICWNVHKASDEKFTEDVEELLEAVPEKNNLTLCFQEVRSTTFDMIKGLHREAVSGHYAPSWRLPFTKKSTGVLTIGNQPLPESGVVPIRAPRRELYVASPKVSLKSEIPLNDGRKIQVVNCHGLNFVPFSVLPKQLDRIFDTLEDSNAPAIVCGDFNVWSERRLKLLNQRTAEAGLVEAHPRGVEHSPAPRWLRWMNRINGFDPEIRLDRIYTRGLEVLDCYSHTGSESSDHLPLVLSYKVLPEE
ncbi:endonuclease/exonuclease/phosphatase family protein [Haloferula sp.]|uniref:endonuclease/exonuclease/phosphatase family protein n=1 Tax=Haloferula sp. TaxID=2497595 RepID=UPI00329DB1D2